MVSRGGVKINIIGSSHQHCFFYSWKIVFHLHYGDTIQVPVTSNPFCRLCIRTIFFPPVQFPHLIPNAGNCFFPPCKSLTLFWWHIKIFQWLGFLCSSNVFPTEKCFKIKPRFLLNYKTTICLSVLNPTLHLSFISLFTRGHLPGTGDKIYRSFSILYLILITYGLFCMFKLEEVLHL